MRLARTWSVALVGMEARIVEVEVSVASGLPRTSIVGLPDAALNEARERCRAAVMALGRTWPAAAVTINLSPATLPKAGSHFDLAILLALLTADAAVPAEPLARAVVLGEVGLDGRVRPVRGVLPSLLSALDEGFTRAIVPFAQVREARLVEGLEVVGVASLAEAVAILRGEAEPREPAPGASGVEGETPKDLADVVGQMAAKWSLEVAAAGGHHLYFHGAPGVGKTLLAERLPGILPDLTRAESLEVSAIHSLAGTDLGGGLITRPPYADPHHSASVAALVGGGARVARPGAISLAHRGVLFLDEVPEFSPRALEALRTPLESGRVVLSRSEASATYPARFQLVLAANPCPCGNYGSRRFLCSCAPMAVRRYRERVSGPILDRIDITQELKSMSKSYLRAAVKSGESSAAVAARVVEARARQRVRLASLGYTTNAEVPGPVLRRKLPLPAGTEQLDVAVARGQLSARGVDKVMRLAWTVCDLAGKDAPTADHVAAAMAMRLGTDRVGEALCG